MISPAWVDSARKEILALPEGETLSADQIVSRVRDKIMPPQDEEWWAIPLGEAECVNKLQYTGKCQRFVNYLPRNPIYILLENPEPETANNEADFWEKLKGGVS